MSFKRKRKKRTQEAAAEIPMTPMIDVVFQLLIYFIVTLKPEDIKTHLEVYRPDPDKKQEEIDTEPNLVRIAIFSDGYTINERPLSIDALAKTLTKLASYDDNQTVLIFCSSSSRHERLVMVLDRCAQAGLKNLSVMSTN